MPPSIRYSQPHALLARAPIPDIPGLGAELIRLGSTLRLGNTLPPPAGLFLPIIAALVRDGPGAVTNIQATDDPGRRSTLFALTIRIPEP